MKSKKGAGGVCFIATAAWGSPQAEEVVVLRHYRDEYLTRNRFGRWTINFYNRVGPKVATFVAPRPALRRLVRSILKPFIEIVKRSSVERTEE